MIRVTCPKCDTPYNVKDSLAGKSVKCSKCSTSIPVPEGAGSVVEAQPASRSSSSSRGTSSDDATWTAEDMAKIKALKVAHDNVLEQLRKSLVGQDAVVRLTMLSLFSQGHCLLMGAPQVGRESGVDVDAAFELIGQRGQSERRVAADKLSVGITAAIRGRVGIDAQQLGRQLELVLQRLVAAQSRANHQHGIATAIKRFDGRLQVVGAERQGVVLGHDAAALRAADDAEAHGHQAGHRSARRACPAAQPQQWSALASQGIG